MKYTIALAALAVAALLSIEPAAKADPWPFQIAQIGIDVDIGGGARDDRRDRERERARERERERERMGGGGGKKGPVIILDPRGRDCRNVTTTVERNGRSVTRTERRCD